MDAIYFSIPPRLTHRFDVNVIRISHSLSEANSSRSLTSHSFPPYFYIPVILITYRHVSEMRLYHACYGLNLKYYRHSGKGSPAHTVTDILNALSREGTHSSKFRHAHRNIDRGAQEHVCAFEARNRVRCRKSRLGGDPVQEEYGDGTYRPKIHVQVHEIKNGQ